MKKRKTLSLVLLIAMIMQLCVPVGAANVNSTGGTVCTHHVVHSAECGYSEAVPCTHEHTEGCYNGEEACAHIHDQACGYSDAAVCGFDPANCLECIKEDESSNEAESTVTELTGFAELSDTVKYQSVALHTEEGALNLPETLTATSAQGEELVPVLTWSAYNVTDDNVAKEQTTYDGTTPGGAYLFLPTLAQGYTLSEGVSLPEISVMVGQAPQTLEQNSGIDIDIGTASQYIVITSTGYKVGNQAVETAYTGPYVLYSTTGTATGTNATKSHITVNHSRTTPIDITLRDVNIATSYIDKCAFVIEQGAVNLTLEGNSSLTSGSYQAGLRVRKGAELTITDASTGSLTAKGGERGGAGIGGNDGETSGRININGGTVTAIGTAYSSNNYGSAGIGSGYAGGSSVAGGTINISGGTVTATGGKGAAGIGGAAGFGSGSGGKITITGGNVKANGGFRAAAIGGGERGSGGNVVISGGVVEAVGSYETASIGGGYLGSNGSFSTGTNGTAVIFANSGIADQTNEAKWRGIIASGSGSRLYGSNAYTFTENVTIPSNHKIYLTRGQTLTVPDGITITVNGKLYTYGGNVTTTSSGKIVNPENIWGSAPIDVSGSQTVEISSHGGDSCYGHYITGKTKENKVLVNGGTHDITIKDLSIDMTPIDDACAFEIIGGAHVNLTLVGNNTLISEDYKAGIHFLRGNDLTITRESTGSLTAQGGHSAAGIGGGYVDDKDGASGTLIIDGGTINAKGGTDGAGIGSGYNDTQNRKTAGSIITINGGNITATGNGYSAGIGGGRLGAGGTITINGGTVNAIAGYIGTGIGGGSDFEETHGGASGDITINGGTINATGIGGAGIGSGIGSIVQKIIIAGGTVTATARDGNDKRFGGAGIGSGYDKKAYTVAKGDIIISGGIINATGNNGGAGIGGGANSGINNIEITGGMITATGSKSGAGIGGGAGAKVGTITIDGDAVVFAKAGYYQAEDIGAGNGGTGGTVHRTRGIIFEGNSGEFYGDNVTLPANTTLDPKKALTIHSGKTLTVPENITLTNNGALYVNDGNVTGAGKINGSGKFIATMLSEDIAPIPDQAYTGKEIKPTVTVNSTRKILGQDFEIISHAFSTRYENNINVGEAKVVFTYSGTSFEKPFQIVKSGTVFDGGVKIYNQNVETTSFTYGDTITVKVKPKATGVAATRNAPAANQMALYVGDTQLCQPVNADSNGMYTMTYDTTRKAFMPGNYPITAKYVGNANMADSSAKALIELKEKELTATPASNASKPYDGNKSFSNVALTLNGIEAGDSVSARASGTGASANAGTHAFTATTTALWGNYDYFYTLDPTAVSGNVKITPATPTLDLTAAKKQVFLKANIGSHDDTIVLTATTGGANGEKPNGSVTFKHGDITIATVSTINGVATCDWEKPPVGTNKVTASFTASTGNYDRTPVTASHEFGIDKVDQQTLKIAAVTGKTYGAPAFALSTTGGSGSGAVSYLVPPDNGVLSISGNMATIVGAGTVTVTASKAGDSNYNAATATTIIKVLPKPVTVSITGANKIYDGNPDATVTYVVGGKGSEDVVASGTATFDNASAGTGKTVTATGITLGGADAKNYTLSRTTATTTASITPKPLSWDKAGTVASKVYDGTTAATVATNPTLVGVVSGDIVTVKQGTVAFVSEGADTGKSVTATGFGIQGAAAGNYSAPAIQPTFASGTITARNITPTVAVGGTHTFSGVQIRPALDQIVVKDGNTVVPTDNYTVAYGANIHAGTGSVTVTLKGNYSGTATQTFAIGKATTTNKVIPDEILMTQGTATAYSIPLPTGLANAGEMSYEMTTIGNSSIFSKPPTISGTEMEFTSSSTATIGEKSTVVITASTANYNDFTFTLTIALTAKASVSLTGLTAEQGLVYTGQPQNGYTGALKAQNGADVVDIGTPVYTYMGISGTVYSSSIAPTKAGSYNLLVSVAADNSSYTGSHGIITFTIGKAPVTVNLSDYAIAKTWDGTDRPGTASGTLAVSGVVIGETVTVTATPQAYPSSDVGTHNVTVDLTLSDPNYVLKSTTITVSASITASDYKGTQATAPSAIPAAKSSNSITLQSVSVDGETVEYAKNTTNTAPTGTWQADTTFGSLNPATQHYFFARVKANTNHGEGTASAGTAITTEKSVYTGLRVKSISLTNGKVWDGTVTPDELLGSPAPAGAAFGTIVKPSTMLVLDSISVDAQGKLHYTSKNNPVGTSLTDVYTVMVTSDKYQDFTVTISFSTSEKAPATLSATLANKVYDGTAMAQPTPTATGGGTDITNQLTYTYQWKKDGELIDAAPKNVGAYYLVITGSNDSYAGSLTIPFLISPKPLTITAENKFIVFGAPAPTYTHVEYGLVAGDTLSGVTYRCDYQADAPDTGMARTAIVPTDCTVSSGNGNYAINYVPGTLTINPNIETLEAAIVAASAVKDSVIISDKTPSEMESGKRFVSAEVMDAFVRALAAAEASKTAATTPQEIADALTALDAATNVFKAAIQVGTYYSGGSWNPPAKPKPKKPNTDSFTDVAGHWAEESIKFVVAESLFNGTSTTSFSPDMHMDRAMLVTVLGRMAKIDPSKYADTQFADVAATAYYASFVAWAAELGVVKGTGTDSFSPTRAITRQELAVMLVNYAKVAGLTLPKTENTQKFADNDSIAPWAQEAMSILQQADILTGRLSNLAEPNATASRAEVATLLQRFMELTSK